MNGHDWTSKYRDLAAAAKALDVESAIVDGEIVVLNEEGKGRMAQAGPSRASKVPEG
jgi:ATP-dependent DNA ligase